MLLQKSFLNILWHFVYILVGVDELQLQLHPPTYICSVVLYQLSLSHVKAFVSPSKFYVDKTENVK